MDGDFTIDDLREQEEARERSDGAGYEDYYDEHGGSEPYTYDDDQEDEPQ